MNKHNFLIYGSYGYTGKLIADLACSLGYRPVLGGRNQEKLINQAKQLNLDYKVFDLNDVAATKSVLKDYIAVIHCAGPFINTYKNMITACIETQTHYLDITGEVEVFEQLAKMDKTAQAANIMVLPGAGFDVVPSDCLAQHLKSRLPDAEELILAIQTETTGRKARFNASRGTAKSMICGLGAGAMIRDNGKLIGLAQGIKQRSFSFGEDKAVTCMTISWGDLSTAWWSTKIPSIETYMAIPDKLARTLKLIHPVKSIFHWQPLQRLLKKQMDRIPEGPTTEMREHSYTQIYGEAKNSAGIKIASVLTGPNGYNMTALTVLNILKKVLAGNAPIGFQTPSTAYGKDLILEIANVTRRDL